MPVKPWKDIRREPYNSNNKKKEVKYFHIGAPVYINAHHPSDSRTIYTCEARVIRTPSYIEGPYKLLVTAVKTNKATYEVQKLLGLKLLRKQVNVFSASKSTPWTGQDTDPWVRLDEARAGQLVFKAIRNINKERRRRKKAI